MAVRFRRRWCDHLPINHDMPLSEFFKDVQNRGWRATTTWQVDYGVEIVDTNGNPERFDFTDFAITDS